MTRFKTLAILTLGAIAATLLTAHAQPGGAGVPPAPAVNAQGNITLNGVTLPALSILNQEITLNGQTFLLTTNASGGYTVATFGPSGSNTVNTPISPQQAVQTATTYVQNNNPANIGYYSTNGEWDVSIGGAFAQNSGQGAATLSLERYGVIPSQPNLSLGGSLLEGNSAGQSGTAAAYGFIDYRRPIGDVAFVGGVGGGYDNYNKSPMGIGKIEVEYRQNKHLGEYVGAGYAFEGTKTDRGLIIGGGIRYAF